MARTRDKVKVNPANPQAQWLYSIYQERELTIVNIIMNGFSTHYVLQGKDGPMHWVPERGGPDTVTFSKGFICLK